jgi:hypothetical protein
MWFRADQVLPPFRAESARACGRGRSAGRKSSSATGEVGGGFLGDVVAGRNGCPAHLAGQRRQIATGSP